MCPLQQKVLARTKRMPELRPHRVQSSVTMIPIATYTIKLLKYSLIIGVIAGAVAIGTGNLTLDATTDTAQSALQNATNSNENRTGEYQEGINITKTEAHFVTLLNQERASRGLQNVTRNPTLTNMGQRHSRDMALKDYFSHTEPDGDTIKDRYEKNGLIPQCHLPIKGTDEYYAGAENIAQTSIHIDVEAAWASGGTYYVSNAKELAWAIFQMWMHSKGHREAMLVHSADEAGLGINITDQNRVYASLELC